MTYDRPAGYFCFTMLCKRDPFYKLRTISAKLAMVSPSFSTDLSHLHLRSLAWQREQLLPSVIKRVEVGGWQVGNGVTPSRNAGVRAGAGIPIGFLNIPPTLSKAVSSSFLGATKPHRFGEF